MERQSGYYWIQFITETGWEPAEYRKSIQRWSLPGTDFYYKTDAFEIIGPRIEPPTLNQNRVDTAPSQD